jgi:hypothetical protein
LTVEVVGIVDNNATDLAEDRTAAENAKLIQRRCGDAEILRRPWCAKHLAIGMAVHVQSFLSFPAFVRGGRNDYRLSKMLQEQPVKCFMVTVKCFKNVSA